MEEKVICEKCGGEMTPYKKDHTSGMICENCGFGWVTTCSEEIENNKPHYVITLKLDYSSSPIFGEYYSTENHRTVTGNSVIDEDKILQAICNKMQAMYSSYYKFDSHGEACWFNSEQQKKDKQKMIYLLQKLKARLNELNDGSFVIDDHITPEYEKIL